MKRIYIFIFLVLTSTQSLADGPYDGIFKFTGYVKGQEFQNGIQFILDSSIMFLIIEESNSNILVTFLNPKQNSWQVFQGERVDNEMVLFPIYDKTDYLNSNIHLEVEMNFLDNTGGNLTYTIVGDPAASLSSGDLVIQFDPISFEKVSF